MDIANLKVGNNTYGIKDNTARQNSQNAQTSADNANTKIDNSKIIGNYTEGTETLEILLEIGTIE